MTSIASLRSGIIFWHTVQFLTPGLLQALTIIFVSAFPFLSRGQMKKSAIKIGLVSLVLLLWCVFFPYRLLSLPVTALIVSGYCLWCCARRKWVLGVFITGLWLAGSLVIMAMGLAIVGPWVFPPSKAEIIALVRKVGPQHLRADAAKLKELEAKSNEVGYSPWRIQEDAWPESFKALMPVSIQSYNLGLNDYPALEIFLFKIREMEICLDVVPAGSDQRLDVGAFGQNSPFPYWREKIADGVYWYSTMEKK